MKKTLVLCCVALGCHAPRAAEIPADPGAESRDPAAPDQARGHGGPRLFGPTALPSPSRPAAVVQGSPPRSFPARVPDARSRAYGFVDSRGSRRPTVHLAALRVEPDGGVPRALEWIAATAAVNLWVRGEARASLDDAQVELDHPGPISARAALDLVLELAGSDVGESFAWWFRDGVLQVGLDGSRGRELTTYVFEVGDLVTGVRSFPAREMQVWPSGGALPAAEEDALEPLAAVSEDRLIDLIRATVLPDTWDEDGVSMRISNGKLIVQHYR